MDTPNRSLLWEWIGELFTHPHMLCQKPNGSWEWGDRFISLCVPIGMHSICDPFWQVPNASPLRGLGGLKPLQAIRPTSLVFGWLVGRKCCCFPKELRAGCWSRALYRCKSVTTFYAWLLFFFWLPHLASHSTLKYHPILSLAQTCKPSTGKCHQEILRFQTLHIIKSSNVTRSHLHITSGQWNHASDEFSCKWNYWNRLQSFLHKLLFTLSGTLEDLYSYSVSLFILWLLAMTERDYHHR